MNLRIFSRLRIRFSFFAFTRHAFNSVTKGLFGATMNAYFIDEMLVDTIRSFEIYLHLLALPYWQLPLILLN